MLVTISDGSIVERHATPGHEFSQTSVFGFNRQTISDDSYDDMRWLVDRQHTYSTNMKYSMTKRLNRSLEVAI